MCGLERDCGWLELRLKSQAQRLGKAATNPGYPAYADPAPTFIV